MNLFIDTNIYLSFYHFSSDDLEELEKLRGLLDKGEVTLLVPDQVVSEFRRNRDGKISDALKRLRDQRLGLQFPQLCKGYPEYDTLRNHQKGYEQSHSALLERLTADIAREELTADRTIGGLLGAARRVELGESVVSRARLRCELGNPPGKKGSLGDAVNWECLLEAVPEGEDLHFVTEDGDYCSPLDPYCFDSFLLKEWVDSKMSQLHFHKRLSAFLDGRFEHIRLANELEKESLIAQLASSPSFLSTHYLVGQLSRYSDFTSAQLNAIAAAAVGNTQVAWIIADGDVSRFLRQTIHGREDELDENLLSELRDLFGDGSKTDGEPTLVKDEDLPF